MSFSGDTHQRFTIAVQKLEFDKIIDRVARFASSEPGRDHAHRLSPSTDPSLIRTELQSVSEAKELLIAEGSFPLDGIKNIASALRKTLIDNQILSAHELLDVASTLKASRVLHAFFKKRKSAYPQLSSFLPLLFFDKIVEHRITEAIDESGRMRDTASRELKTIRREIIDAGELLRKQLQAILKIVSEQEFTQEEIITTRDGRLVIPVKTEHKKHVPGFIHSSSASGATVYIEPAECLELNNTLRELHLREEREIEKVLGELTAQVREIREPLERTLSALAHIDLICSKAKYSIEILGNPPHISSHRRIRLAQARHPVLLQRHSREEIVPLDLELGDAISTLVITGPNAGGKSVAMKTVGLLVLCTQAGLHIPAAPESEVPIFDQVFVDIGDDQSIENDLSTFSSHILRLKEILAEADERSLVLIDEIGAGTDPGEGAALAAAILQELTTRHTITIATTHHGMLKAFAHEIPGMANGSLEFDVETLRPTYYFKFGVPGSSYALELAQRLGITPSLLAKAREQLGTEKTKLEALLAEVERQTQHYRREIHEAEKERALLQTLVDSYEKKMAEIRKEISEIRQKALDEARALLDNAQGTIERTVKEIRESAADRNRLQAARGDLKAMSEEIEELHNTLQTRTKDETFVVGDKVHIEGTSETGEIIELRDQEAIVIWRNGRLRVPIKKLLRDVRSERGVLHQTGPTYTPDAKTEIDLRGMIGDEAIESVQRVLDDALVAGLHRIDIIHGKGTGALRKRVSDFLKGYPHVKSFRLGEWNEGGSGVTVVELE